MTPPLWILHSFGFALLRSYAAAGIALFPEHVIGVRFLFSEQFAVFLLPHVIVLPRQRFAFRTPRSMWLLRAAVIFRLLCDPEVYDQGSSRYRLRSSILHAASPSVVGQKGSL